MEASLSQYFSLSLSDLLVLLIAMSMYAGESVYVWSAARLSLSGPSES